MGIIRVRLRAPLIGAKCFVVDQKGVFVMEEGPGTLQAIACTHAGSGTLVAIDGVPDENGFFPDEFGQVDLATAPDEYWTRNGRTLYKANPVVMGMWQLQAGFFHGLTLIASGGNISVGCIASVVWNPFKQRVVPAAAEAPTKPANA